MPLTPGARLGPYEILAPIGAGGMGEVYRARDSRLERTVAIKVLPSHLSDNPDLRQRFEREARVVSSLNHPHICTLYDIGRQDGVDFLVMEYLEGETLADRLAKGRLPTDQVLQTAVEIADALDKAHRQGVVHRDLKPGNVMLTKSGTKLLDFGLAKLQGAGPGFAFPAASALPTASRPLTAEGRIPGTLQYMAPEQLEGKEADARTDLFALGEIIYEMATGRKAFEGNNQASVIAAILTSEPPPIQSLQPMTPPMLDRAVKRCLAKDPEARWQSARDLLLELEWIGEASTRVEAPPPWMARRRRSERLVWLMGVAALATALGLAIVHFKRPTSQPDTVRFLVSPPGNAAIEFIPVSPDGRYLSFTASSGGQTQLWLRPLNALSARPLPGTERARYHFWSPDSRFIGFFAEGKLKKIDVTGGLPQTVCDAPGSGPMQLGTWSRDGTILFNVFEAPGQEGLYRVSAAGGAVTRIPILDESGKELLAFWPHFLPDSRHFVFTCIPAGDIRIEKAGLCVASLDAGHARKLSDTASAAEYAPPGYLLYSRSGTLLAHPFDAAKLRLHGEPVQIVERIEHYGNVGVPSFSVSENGVLAYFSAGGTQSRLIWKDRKGLVLGQVGPQAEYVDMRLSPDGRKLAASINDPQARATDIWMIELARNVATRFTTSEAGDAGFALWSPDGSRIVFSMPENAPPFLHQKPLTGGEQEVLLPSTGTMQWATDWSPDGRFLLYADRNPNTNWDIWILPLAGERKPLPFLRTRFRETQATFSPDGRWVAYVSDESGSREVYVQPFQGPGERRRISPAGGSLPRWRRDGRELFYLSLDNQLMAVPLKSGASFEPETPTALFAIDAAPTVETEYDVSSDGQRFIVNSEVPGTAGPPTVVLNWTSELKR